MAREPHANPINLRCADCGFKWTNTIWLPLDAGRFARALKQLCECPSCGAAGKKILMGHEDLGGITAKVTEERKKEETDDVL